MRTYPAYVLDFEKIKCHVCYFLDDPGGVGSCLTSSFKNIYLKQFINESVKLRLLINNSRCGKKRIVVGG